MKMTRVNDRFLLITPTRSPKAAATVPTVTARIPIARARAIGGPGGANGASAAACSAFREPVTSEAVALAMLVNATRAAIANSTARGLVAATLRVPLRGHRNVIDPDRVSCVAMKMPMAKPISGKKMNVPRLRVDAIAPMPVVWFSASAARFRS